MCHNTANESYDYYHHEYFDSIECEEKCAPDANCVGIGMGENKKDLGCYLFMEERKTPKYHFHGVARRINRPRVNPMRNGKMKMMNSLASEL